MFYLENYFKDDVFIFQHIVNPIQIIVKNISINLMILHYVLNEWYKDMILIYDFSGWFDYINSEKGRFFSGIVVYVYHYLNII